MDSIEITLIPAGTASRIIAPVDHAEALAIGESYVGGITLKVPGLPPGDYFWRVVADARNKVFEALLEENNSVESGPFTIDLPALTFGVPLTGQFMTEGDELIFILQAAAGQNIRTKLDRGGSMGRSELFVGAAYAPDSTSFDFTEGGFGGPDASLDISNAREGFYFIVLKATILGQSSQSIQLLAENHDFQVGGVTPDSGGNADQVPITVNGQGLPAGATAKLITFSA